MTLSFRFDHQEVPSSMMSAGPAKLPLGAQAAIPKTDLQNLIETLQQHGYQVIGPQVTDGAIVLDVLDSIERLPAGWLDVQDAGRYRLHHEPTAGYFDHVVGPQSLKPYLFPPQETVEQLRRTEAGWEAVEPTATPQAIAVVGVRSCDLHALAIQDRVFLEGPYIDPGYQARRQNLFLVSVQCRRAAATCFCHSMKTGPRASQGFDLALTELDDVFVIEVGSEVGSQVLAATPGWTLASSDQVDDANHQSTQLSQHLQTRTQQPTHGDEPRPRSLETAELRETLLANLDHPHWQRVAERCLSCANCTLVCPTCFCSSVTEVSDLTGDEVHRQREWSSCFNAEHSYISSGVVHGSTASRYRQWLTHKLATWHDQFGTSGCVGCGRCITWCPVGIDLTEEVVQLREPTP